ncbi:GGDEF domain-containing protein [Thermomonas fusca]|nr:GGDEF domain-containing protein [Thermomonas fusca]
MLALPVRAADGAITVKALEAQPKIPAEFARMTYPQRIEWLERQLASITDPVRRYQLVSERAIQHYQAGNNALARADCRLSKPAAFDFQYRLVCATISDAGGRRQTKDLLGIHADAIKAGDIDIATQALSSAAWAQSETGDIAAAFQSYERALKLAEKARPETLIDVTLNTATLYVVHGDRAYINKGIALQEDAIARFRAMKRQYAEDAGYFDSVIAMTQFNAGVAHALHLHDYARALHWFGQVAPGQKNLRQGVLVFSALSAVELGRTAQARQWLRESRETPPSTETDTAYLGCYQQLVQLKLEGQAALAACRDFSPETPLEVRLDLYKRLAVMAPPDWRLAGLEGLHRLFVRTLEPQLKQSAIRAASHTELRRLELESKLVAQLLEKEQALKRAEQEKLATQRLLAAATVAILLLVLLVIVLRLLHNRKLARQFRSMSLEDGLTGLRNRRYFEHNVGREIGLVKRAGQEGDAHSIAFCLFDIDHFKRINDQHGHEAGDRVLVEFARRIKDAIRDTDMLVRWGGEEFLLVARVAHAGEPCRIGERIRAAVSSDPFVIPGGASLDVTCTSGIVPYPRMESGKPAEITWQQLVQLADAALYLGKRKSRDCWVCIDRIPDIGALDRILAQDLEVSLREGLVELSDSSQTSARAGAA